MNKLVYLIQPLEHGNGGWYGWEVLAEIELDKILKLNPVKVYLDGDYSPEFGSTLRVCETKNPNKPLYFWDHEENKWDLVN